MEDLYNHARARSVAQAQDMHDLESRGECLFCVDVLQKDPEHVFYYENEDWVVTNNRFPYRDTKLHLLLVPKHHVRELTDLRPEALFRFWDALNWSKENFNLDFYSLGARSGDFTATGATIAHLHIHLVVGDVDAPGHSGVDFRMSSARTR